MKRSSVLRRTAAVLLGALVAAAGAFAAAQTSVASNGPAATAKTVAGTVDTRLVLNRFTAVGKRIVGHGTATSTLRNASGVRTSTTQRPFTLTLRTATGPGPCQILYLELDEVDLTLLGLRVFLRSATEGEPIKLTLSADSTHGILGKLFCDLSKTSVSPPKLRTAARALTKKVHSTTLMRANATLYSPTQRRISGVRSSTATADVANCAVLHLILGPLHLDVLGLIVDLNKVALDLEAIPGTTLGDLFCSLAGGSGTTSTATTSTATTATTTTGTTTTTP
jgi:hypothetical protein